MAMARKQPPAFFCSVPHTPYTSRYSRRCPRAPSSGLLRRSMSMLSAREFRCLRIDSSAKKTQASNRSLLYREYQRSQFAISQTVSSSKLVCALGGCAAATATMIASLCPSSTVATTDATQTPDFLTSRHFMACCCMRWARRE